MSQENVELVLALTTPGLDMDMAQIFRDDERWAAFLGAMAPFLHPDFECVAHAFGTEMTYAGTDGLRVMWLDWMAPWATYRAEIEEAIDCGEKVLLLAHEFGHREGSEQEVRGDNAGVWTVRDGKIARWEAYADRAEALAAVGLRD